MRILANENFPGGAVNALEQLGYDVLWIRTVAPGSSDQEVLQRAQIERRILLTFDKDFGELAFRFGLPAGCGVILFRIRTPSPQQMVKVIVAALTGRRDWENHFAVVEDDRIRMRPLP